MDVTNRFSGKQQASLITSVQDDAVNGNITSRLCRIHRLDFGSEDAVA